MNICMLNTFRYRRGGDSAYSMGLEALLEARGHDVVPFAMHHEQELPSPYAGYFADEIDYPALLAEGGLGNAWKVLQSSIYNRQARSSIARLLDHRPVQLVHAHSVMHHLTASVMLECYTRGIPVVWTLHDLKAVCPTTLYLRDGKVCEECKGGRFYNAVRHRCKRGRIGPSLVVAAELYLHRMWKVYEKADLLIAPSGFLRSKLLESGLRPRRIEVLHNYVDTAGIDSAAGSGDYVLYVGRVSREKGVETLIKACASRGIPLRIAGTGELLGPLRERASAEGWTDVSFEGHSTGADLASLYRDARIVAVPSEWQENCPLVVLEAFAWGKPVIASRLGGLVELVEDQGVGQLVSPGSVEEWGCVVDEWMSAPSRCRSAGSAAREVAESLYSPGRHLDRLEEFYGEIASHLPSGARRGEGAT